MVCSLHFPHVLHPWEKKPTRIGFESSTSWFLPRNSGFQRQLSVDWAPRQFLRNPKKEWLRGGPPQWCLHVATIHQTDISICHTPQLELELITTWIQWPYGFNCFPILSELNFPFIPGTGTAGASQPCPQTLECPGAASVPGSSLGSVRAWRSWCDRGLPGLVQKTGDVMEFMGI
jgi:hypothetical protein